MSNSSRRYQRHGYQVETYQQYGARLRGYGYRGWRWIGYALLAVILAIVCSVVIVPSAHAQRTTNTFNVYDFRTSVNPQTVGAMTTAAQNQCISGLNCVIIFDPILGGFSAGTMPTKCAACIWLDYRTPAMLSVSGFEGVLLADTFPGADCGLKITAADASTSSAVEIWVNQSCGTAQWSNISLAANHTVRIIQGGTYNIGTITLNTNDSLYCGTPLSTILLYSGSGNALSTTGGNTIDGCEFSLGSSVVEGFHITGTEVSFHNWYLLGGGNSTKMLHSAAFNGSIQSGTIKLRHGRIFNYTGTGITVDHTVDIWANDISDFGAPSNTTAIGVVIETGTSGLYWTDVEINQNGAGGMIVKNSTPGAGAYNQWPNYGFFTHVLIDAYGLVPNSDGLLGDSSLSTNPVYMRFVDCWFVGHGISGVHLSGGQGWKFLAGTLVRSNGTNGYLLDNANVAWVEIGDNFVTGNNVTNAADAHGVYISASVQHVNIHGNTIVNALDTTGHQKYGIKVQTAAGASVNADRLRVVDNELSPNDTGYQLINNTGQYSDCLNDSDVSSTATECYIPGDVHVHGDLKIDQSVFGTTAINVVGQYQINNGRMWASSTTPTIAGAGCGGSSASISTGNSTIAFDINVGTAPTAGGCTVTMPAATTRWNCSVEDYTTISASVFKQKQTSSSTTSVVFQNYSTAAAATAPTANDIYHVQCSAE
jgi:hypothetical protein